MKINREKLPLLVGILLPILLIIFVFVTSYLPSQLVKPTQNFIYAVNPNYASNVATVRVINGKAEVDTASQINPQYPTTPTILPVFYVYDVASDRATQISLEQVQSYKVDPSTKSTDGFTVGRPSGDSGGFPFFFGSGNYGIYLTGKGLRKEITQDPYNFQFVGWVTK